MVITAKTITELIKQMPYKDKCKILQAIQKDVESERAKMIKENFIMIC